jgi:hypothetical protein
MTHVKAPPQVAARASAFLRDVEGLGRLDPDTAELLRMASLLGPRDRAALSHIIRRAREIYETDGEETALAVLDQIEAILTDRLPDA